MRYLTPAELLEAVSATLRNVVMPDCTSRTAVGQLWAAIGILDNLAAQVDETAAIAEAEQSKLQDWLASLGPSDAADEADGLVATRDRCRERLARPDTLPANALSNLREVLTDLAEGERRWHRPVNFVAAFEAPSESARTTG